MKLASVAVWTFCHPWKEGCCLSWFLWGMLYLCKCCLLVLPLWGTRQTHGLLRRRRLIDTVRPNFPGLGRSCPVLFKVTEFDMACITT